MQEIDGYVSGGVHIDWRLDESFLDFVFRKLREDAEYFLYDWELNILRDWKARLPDDVLVILALRGAL
jgi:hypothetical protein